MRVEASDNYKARAKKELKVMLETDQYENLPNIAWGLNRIKLWHNIKLSEKEIATILYKELTE